MPSASYKKRMTTALAAAALASAMAVSGAHAHYGTQSSGSPEVAPPASSIAASAGEEYQDLRSPDTRDLAEGSRPTPAQQPVVAQHYQDLRSPDTRDQAEAYAPTPASASVVDEPSEPSGFDPVSAAIGAVAAAALSLVLMATLSTRRATGRRAASA